MIGRINARVYSSKTLPPCLKGREMTSENIWPVRFIELHGRAKYGSLTDEETATIRGIVSSERNSVLPSPVALDGWGVRLIDLVPLGEDRIGRGQILLRVTHERASENVNLRLATVPYPASITPEDELEPITPDAAGRILDRLVAQLKEVPNLVRQDNIVRKG